MPDPITYRTFPNPAVAQPLLALLAEANVTYTTDHARARFNAALGVTSDEQFVVRLRPDDFTRARQLEQQQASATLAVDELPTDYYLFGFSNAELWELLAQPSAWSSLDVALATHLLNERGETVNVAALEQMRRQDTAALAAPNASPNHWIFAGYAMAVLGGLGGIGIGWGLWRYQKTLPDGRQVPGFSEEDRYHGRVILTLGCVMFGLGLLGFGILKLGLLGLIL